MNAYDPPTTVGNLVPKSVCNRVLIPSTKRRVCTTLTLSSCTNKSIYGCQFSLYIAKFISGQPNFIYVGSTHFILLHNKIKYIKQNQSIKTSKLFLVVDLQITHQNNFTSIYLSIKTTKQTLAVKRT